jgi:DNA polymerase III subunit epsilon
VRALADLDVLIVDCQTTGASPAFGVVLELAWGVTRASGAELGAFESHFITLPEGHAVPEQVVKLTGYDPARSAQAIADQEAWRRLRNSVQGVTSAPTAIHYARFELSFLRDWAGRFEPQGPFPLDAVCVHAIARRLYPDLPRQSLRALAGFLGHGLELTRNSLGHVEATAFVWRKLCAELGTRGIETWEELQAWLATRAPAIARPKKPKYPILPTRYQTLPREPGVYRFLRSNGDVLYVGKAANLRTRTASHFSTRTGKQVAPEMLTQVSDIQVTVVASALEAALLEHDTIRALRPPYNVQLTTTDLRVWYSSGDFMSAAATPEEAHAIGPLPSEYSLRALGAQIALTSGALPAWPLRAG